MRINRFFENYKNLAIGLFVHLLTASGAALAVIATIEAWRLNWPGFFTWLGIALIVDGLDGPIARSLSIKTKLEKFSGDIIDLVVDYLTYAFLPAIAIVMSGLVPDFISHTLAIIIVISSALYFADTSIKLKNNAFRGFPCAWNALVLLFFIFQPPWEFIAVLTVCSAILIFTPIAFVHPVRVERWRSLTITITVAWLILAAISLWNSFDTNIVVKICLFATTCYLMTVSAIQQLIGKRTQQHNC